MCAQRRLISLGIRPVWSVSSLCAQWVAKDPRFLNADSEDCMIRLGRCPGWSASSLGTQVILLVLLCSGSNYFSWSTARYASVICNHATPKVLRKIKQCKVKQQRFPHSLGLLEGICRKKSESPCYSSWVGVSHLRKLSGIIWFVLEVSRTDFYVFFLEFLYNSTKW